MKVSLGKFYTEVTGMHTGTRSSLKTALTRWGVPFDEPSKENYTSDVVDVAYLEQARTAHAKEKAEREARRTPKPQPAPIDGSIKERVQEMENELKAVKTAVLGLADVVQQNITTNVDTHNRILARQEDIINRLNNLRRYK